MQDAHDTRGNSSRVRRLIAQRMTQRSWADLSRAVGIPQLAVKLDHATAAGRLPPFDVLAPIMAETGITLGEFTTAAAHDAGYGHITPLVTQEDAQLLLRLLRAAPEVRSLVDGFLTYATTQKEQIEVLADHEILAHVQALTARMDVLAAQVGFLSDVVGVTPPGTNGKPRK